MQHVENKITKKKKAIHSDCATLIPRISRGYDGTITTYNRLRESRVERAHANLNWTCVTWKVQCLQQITRAAS